jgi:SNF2 family DNA or RNA helicase
MKFVPYPYQEAAIRWVLDRPASGLFLGMGMGKTVVTLTAISELLFDRLETARVLVIAPLRVARDTWAREAAKWDHLQRLRVSVVLGDARERLAALERPADVYVINRENVPWLCETLFDWPFDMVVIDELSSFKSVQAKRFKALRKVRGRIRRIVGLTGTPAPNGLIDLWPQIYLLDRGERLGKTVGAYRARYFTPDRANGYIVYSYRLLPGADEAIQARIADVCMSLRKEDYLSLPGQLYETVEITPPPALLKQYRQFERDRIMEAMDGDGEIVALNAAALTGKLLQFANGAIYDDNGNSHLIHNLKLDALEDLIEAANGEPVLVFYAFKHDRDRIMRRVSCRELVTSEDIDAWNRKEIPVAIAHPASVGHGLNLQEGGHIIIWFGLTWSLELYQQANERLNRPGQTHVCRIYHLVLKGTHDERVLAALERKDTSQRALIDALRGTLEERKP